MPWNLTEQMRYSFEIFLENKYYIIDHVGSFSVAPGLVRDMMLIWQPALWSSPLKEGNIFLCHGKVTHLTQQ